MLNFFRKKSKVEHVPMTIGTPVPNFVKSKVFPLCIEIPLYTSDNRYVVTVAITDFEFLPELIIWGQRYFIKGPDGNYREAFTFQALHTVPGHLRADGGMMFVKDES
jgi:hypothetical protein